MAIETGNKVTTTGLVDKKPFTPKAPDMSKMKVPEAMQAKRIKPAETRVAPPMTISTTYRTSSRQNSISDR
jgi:hypothetical protein